MSHVSVWRIATDTPDYEADDLSGAGAKATGGRWNRKDLGVVYASETRALACLETIVHLSGGGLPLHRFLVEIRIPKAVWGRARRETSAGFKVGWDSAPHGKVSMDFGSAWILGNKEAILAVPSIIVPEEFNVFINPSHPDSEGIVGEKLRRWTYDPRLVRAS